MATSSDEYKSLRDEMMQHQNRRENVVGLVTTACVGLFAISVQLSSPYIALFVLLLVHSARLHIAHIHYAIQRIGSYIKVMHESDNDDLNWETGSHRLREFRLTNRVWKISSLASIENRFLLISVLSVIISFLLSQPPSIASCIVVISSGVWWVVWRRYGRRIKDLDRLVVYKDMLEFWLEFKNNNSEYKFSGQLSEPSRLTAKSQSTQLKQDNHKQGQ